MPSHFSHILRVWPLCVALSASFLSGCVSESGTKSNSAETLAPKIASESTPKNIILFIGDGMGVSTVTAARIFDGQSQGMSGEEHSLAFEDFGHVAMIKTYNTNSQVPDSAGTATAMFSGYKTNIGAVNVRPDPSDKKMVFNSCVRKNSPPTLTEKAKAAGMSVGVISTARITHATPAAMYGHAVDRDWESDADVDPRAAKIGCKGLAQQLIESDVDIALGGGAKEFTQAQIAAWTERGHIYAANHRAMKDSPSGQALLGLFKKSHMSYEADREGTEEPSLAEMTAFTIDRLSGNDSGYVMMVEAGRVDHAHHGTNAFRAMRDMQALNEAVKTAKAKTGEDTLIIVTADHSHVFVMQGYPKRGNPILGLVDNRGRDLPDDAPKYAPAKDGKPYTTLGYYNGPNVRTEDSPALTDNLVQGPDYRQQTAIPLGSETHAGEDVPLYARGPGAARFGGVMEQDEIGKIIADLIVD